MYSFVYLEDSEASVIQIKMTLKTYILVVVAVSAIAFWLLLVGERDTALIFFGILAGFFTNILGLEKQEEENVELEDILSKIKNDEHTGI